MPTLRKHDSFKLVKLLGLGDPGTGKTGSLAALINELPRWGIEQVVIQDWDNGLDILTSYVKPEKQDLVHFATLRDEMKATQTGAQPRHADAFRQGMGLLNNWVLGDEKLGPAVDWGSETLFVLDSITGMGDACMNHTRVHMNIDDDWKGTGAAMKLQDKFIQMLPALKCHVILFSHIRFMGGGGQQRITDKHGTTMIKEVDSNTEGKGFPSALGKYFLPKWAGTSIRNSSGTLMVGGAPSALSPRMKRWQSKYLSLSPKG